MGKYEEFTSVRFRNFKAFRDYSVSLRDFNILVGPNNSGKSTIISAFKTLAEALRKARSKNPSFVEGPDGVTRGYDIDLRNVPIASENIFFDYDDSKAASIQFRISNANELLLFFPEQNVCRLIPVTRTKAITTKTTFKAQYNLSVAFVPILGPVEHNEPLYQEEAARLALITHRASRNFRNIWYHYPEYFDEFSNLVRSTWPGMDIQKPEVDISHEKPLLRMFCPERRIPREIFWAGFGFQVWCQMLTFIVKNKDASIFLIDEPDIYLHSDLQRQLLSILKNLGPDIVIATHSTEIISEADPDDIIVVSKEYRSARRLRDSSHIKHVFSGLGSNLNPIMTQLAKTKRALFVEGKDFQVISKFARKLNKTQIADRSDFAVVPVDGFNAQKVRHYLEGIKLTLGHDIIAASILDRDYRTTEECDSVIASLLEHCIFAHIHERKELENFVLYPSAIERAIKLKLQDNRRAQQAVLNENITDLLDNLSNSMKHDTYGQYMAHRGKMIKALRPGLDESTIASMVLVEFEDRWSKLENRLLLLPGKELLAKLSTYLQTEYSVSITISQIINCFGTDEIPTEMVDLIEKIESFRNIPFSS